MARAGQDMKLAHIAQETEQLHFFKWAGYLEGDLEKYMYFVSSFLSMKIKRDFVWFIF